MRLAILLGLSFALCSCSKYPTPYRDENGRVAYATQWGGKWMHTINSDGSMAWTGDNEISFQHGAQAVTAIASMGAEVILEQISNVTARLANDNLTSIERLKLTNELAALHAQLGHALKQQGIGAGATLGPINFD